MGRYRDTDADTPLHIVDNTDILAAGTELGGEESCCIRIGRDRNEYHGGESETGVSTGLRHRRRTCHRA